MLIRTAEDRVSLGEEVSKFYVFQISKRKAIIFIIKRYQNRAFRKEQKKYISLFGKELYCDLMKICGIESGTNVDEYISFAHIFNIPKFPLSGDDLIIIGHQPGKNLGRNLELLRQHWEDSSYTLTKEELLLYAKSFI